MIICKLVHAHLPVLLFTVPPFALFATNWKIKSKCVTRLTIPKLPYNQGRIYVSFPICTISIVQQRIHVTTYKIWSKYK